IRGQALPSEAGGLIMVDLRTTAMPPELLGGDRSAPGRVSRLAGGRGVGRRGCWLEFWLSEIDGQLRPTPVANYRWIVHRYLIPSLGGQGLGKLRTRRVQRAMDVLCRQRVRGGRLISPGSVHRIREVLRSALS